MQPAEFQGRLTLGRQAERALQAALLRRGFRVARSGQEAWLSPDLYAVLRRSPGDPMSRALRHTPDFLAERYDFPVAYWDAKNNTRAGTAFFALEQAFHVEQLARVGKGERVVVAFRDTDGRLYANWVQELAVMAEIQRFRSQWSGSWSPFLLIGRGSVPPLDVFIERNRRRPA